MTIGYEEGAQVLTSAIAEGIGPKDIQWYLTDGGQSRFRCGERRCRRPPPSSRGSAAPLLGGSCRRRSHVP